jgi:hypothetical protein
VPEPSSLRIKIARVADIHEYRITDSDDIKGDLIQKALQDGIYDDLLARIPAASSLRWRILSQ